VAPSPPAAPRSDRPFSVGGDCGDSRSIAIVFGPCGELILVEDLPVHPAELGGAGLVTAHRGGSPSDALDANFLWGWTSEALGLTSAPDHSTGYQLDRGSFNAFRDLHTRILDGVNDTSVKAFLLFLARWSPEYGSEVPLLQQRVGSAVAFRFRYDDEFLHEKHAARVAWVRRRLFRPRPLPASPRAQWR